MHCGSSAIEFDHAHYYRCSHCGGLTQIQANTTDRQTPNQYTLPPTGSSKMKTTTLLWVVFGIVFVMIALGFITALLLSADAR